MTRSILKFIIPILLVFLILVPVAFIHLGNQCPNILKDHKKRYNITKGCEYRQITTWKDYDQVH